MSITPLTLTGTSQYLSDFQNVLNRAVQIAQIPLTRLQNQDSDLIQKKSLLSGISTAAQALASDLTSLGTIASSNALTGNSSNSAVVQATASGATSAASYTIDSITTLAAPASETSLTGVADSTSTPVSTTGTVNLVVGSKTYTMTLSNNSLIGLRDKINSLGAGVTASILTTSGGNYLNLSANSAGATTLKLMDDPGGANTNLISSKNQGTDAVFSLNGIPIHQQSNTVNSVIPGLTFTLLQTSTTPVTISTSSDGGQLTSALSQFVTDYNALQGQLQAQVGSAAGLLSGDSTVVGMQQLMRQMASYYSGSGSVNSMANLGITFDATGKATFDQTTVAAMTGSQLSDAFSFLGNATSGLAGYQRSLTQYSDPYSGIIKMQQEGIDTADLRLQQQISDRTDRINAMQTSLQQRLAKADELQSQLQTQQQSLTASLQGLNLVLYGKSTQVA